MEEQPENKPNTLFITALLICVLASVVVSFYFFYYKKDYEFVVEVACDVTKETCFQRDCTNPDDCPPNGLSDFKRYSLNAGDFKNCESEDCAIACESGAIKCEPIECAVDEIMGESCSSPENPIDK
jgi:hypothetical protein